MRAQAVLASRNKTMAPVTLSSRPTQDWQDVIVRTTDGAVGRVQSWRNGWVSCSLQCPRPTPVHAQRMVCAGGCLKRCPSGGLSSTTAPSTAVALGKLGGCAARCALDNVRSVVGDPCDGGGRRPCLRVKALQRADHRGRRGRGGGHHRCHSAHPVPAHGAPPPPLPVPAPRLLQVLKLYVVWAAG